MNAGNSSGCYFVGKAVLLKWLSEFLQETVAKVEDCASGHHYIMCLDALYPGQINFGKATYRAQLEWERIENLKIVQDILNKNGVDRVVDVERLSKAKYQDNLEFLQWFAWWFKPVYDPSSAFDPIATRTRFSKKQGAAPPPPAPKPAASTNAVARKPVGQMAAPQHAAAQPVKSSPQQQSLQSGEQMAELDSLRKLAEKRTKESQFYFSKLRQIELLIGDLKDQSTELVEDSPLVPLVEKIEEILYAPYSEK